MQHILRSSAITLALLSSVGFAVAQQSPGSGATPSTNAPPSTASPPSAGSPQQILVLSPAQRRAIVQALRTEQTQSLAGGEQAQIGAKAPGSVSQHPLPSRVTYDMPQTMNMLFVKLPDRILLIDPDQKMVAEIIPTGSDQQ